MLCTVISFILSNSLQYTLNKIFSITKLNSQRRTACKIKGMPFEKCKETRSMTNDTYASEIIFMQLIFFNSRFHIYMHFKTTIQ